MHSPAMQILYDEHDVILKAIEQLEAVLKEENLSAHGEALQGFIDFFREYGDAYHHQKEEDTLFALLSNINQMLGKTLVQALIDHHEMFRENLKEAREAIAENRWDTVRSILSEYVSDLKDHISAENDELFITADELLSDEEKENLYFSFVDKDRELGADRKKAFEEKVLQGTW